MTTSDISAGEEIFQNPVDPGRLERYLATIPELGDSLPIHAIDRIGRGQSNLTFRVTLRQGTVILRRPPMGPLPPSAHDVLREYRVMQGLGNSEVPVPALITACADPQIIGAPFYLMENLPGDAIRFDLPSGLASDPEAPRAIAEQTINTLAALHTTDPAAVGLHDLGKPSGYLARQLRRWKGQLDYARTRPVPNLDWTAEWLEQHMPPDVAQPSIVHGDYKLDNLIFSLQQPAQLLAVVDWEMATLGDPLADLGWLLAFWCEDGTPPRELGILPRVTELPGFPRRHEVAERYAEQTSRSVAGLRYYLVFALWKMAVLLEGHWCRHVRGTAGEFEYGYLEQGGPAFAAYIRTVAEESTSGNLW